MMDLYSIGELLIDFIPGSEPASYIRKAGGAPANVAIAAAKNGLKAGMCCCVGDDAFGRFLMDTLAQYEVKAFHPELCQEAVTTMAIVTLAPDGDRSFTFVRKPGADMLLTEDDVKEADLADSVIVHAGSVSLSASPVDKATVKALKLGHELGKLVSFDINYRDVMWASKDDCTAYVKEILPYVDILKISDEEVDMLGGEENVAAVMAQYGITAVVETLGSKGARCFFDGGSFDVPGRKAVCVDATGAGDAFWGGFLSKLRIQGVEQAGQLNRDVLENAMVYGNVSGWICVQSKGAIESLPTRAQIEAHLA